MMTLMVKLYQMQNLINPLNLEKEYPDMDHQLLALLHKNKKDLIGKALLDHPHRLPVAPLEQLHPTRAPHEVYMRNRCQK